MIVTTLTLHAFEGNPSERQISFFAGEAVAIDTSRPSQGGWIWVMLTRNGSSGWCPQTYLHEAGAMAPPPTSAPPIPPRPLDNDTADMGGSASSQPGHSAGVSEDTPSSGSRVKESFKKLGNKMQRAGRKSWSAVSNTAEAAGTAVCNGTKVVGAHASTAFNSAKEGLQDLQQKQQTVSNKPTRQRTAGEQRAVDVGNYAARGAVACAIYDGILSGGNPMAAARGAAHGGARGASYGAVARWKPFG